MSTRKMHADETIADRDLVRRLLVAQFPQWAHLRLEPVQSAGTDNAIYRLGEDMVVRLPRRPEAVTQIEKEQRWLPRLAPSLPLSVPVPLGRGAPGEGYPWPWSVYTWLEGESAFLERIGDHGQAATDLACFVAALQRIDPAGGPAPGAHNFNRGVPLSARDGSTREGIASLKDVLDAGRMTAVWETALRAAEWNGRPVWLHGDLHAGNLLAVRGRLSAVIDFGGLGVGDPACDLMVAWWLLPAEIRGRFRAGLSIDDATWTRGSGWALSVAVIALPYYRKTNPVLAGMARHAILETLADDYDAGL